MNTQDPAFSPVSSAPDAQQPAGFCQQCGTPLTDQTRRTVAGAVYCEPCLAARISDASPAGATAYQAWTPGVAPQPSRPNPALAAVLGFIPGVGAMYNEQYAKGIAHLTIFALLVLLADANGIFGLFVAGWEFYMALEAYHTARARRDGTPLPNPFGFNDLGERLGFARGWTSPGVHPVGQRQDPMPNGQPLTDAGAQPFGTPAEPASAGSWGQAAYPTAAPAAPYQAGAMPPYPEPAYVPVAPEPAMPLVPVTPIMRFPAGAVWLIVLGVIFLLSTTGIFRGFSGEMVLGWAFIGLAAWFFLRRFKELSALGLHGLRLVSRSLEFSIWLLTSGVLALLDAYHAMSWDRSWPIFIIVGGVVALLSRLAAQQELVAPVLPGTAVPVTSDSLQ